jgi:hypothetical protein
MGSSQSTDAALSGSDITIAAVSLDLNGRVTNLEDFLKKTVITPKILDRFATLEKYVQDSVPAIINRFNDFEDAFTKSDTVARITAVEKYLRDSIITPTVLTRFNDLETFVKTKIVTDKVIERLGTLEKNDKERDRRFD